MIWGTSNKHDAISRLEKPSKLIMNFRVFKKIYLPTVTHFMKKGQLPKQHLVSSTSTPSQSQDFAITFFSFKKSNKRLKKTKIQRKKALMFRRNLFFYCLFAKKARKMSFLTNVCSERGDASEPG